MTTTHIDKFHLSKKYSKHFIKYKVTTYLELCHFFAQADHESNLKPKVESLNYKAESLQKIFGVARISKIDAYKYGRIDNAGGVTIQKANQEMLANILYGNTFGQNNLGNLVFSDGWKYRGRGIFQITGKWNYRRLSADTGIDFVNNPDLLLQEEYSIIAALWFWNLKKLSISANADNLDHVSDIINKGSITKPIGDAINFKDREVKLKKYKLIFN